MVEALCLLVSNQACKQLSIGAEADISVGGNTGQQRSGIVWPVVSKPAWNGYISNKSLFMPIAKMVLNWQWWETKTDSFYKLSYASRIKQWKSTRSSITPGGPWRGNPKLHAKSFPRTSLKQKWRWRKTQGMNPNQKCFLPTQCELSRLARSEMKWDPNYSSTKNYT